MRLSWEELSSPKGAKEEDKLIETLHFLYFLFDLRLIQRLIVLPRTAIVYAPETDLQQRRKTVKSVALYLRTTD
jgi:hypothetical protein